jgi:transposase
LWTVEESVLWTARTAEVPLRQLVAVPVDVGKTTAMLMACDFTGRVLVPAVEFAMTRDGVMAVLARLRAAVPADVRLVRVGVEAAGHYHRPLTAAGVWPVGWQVVELNPAHVTAQRRVNGQRGVKTDRLDLAAMVDLLLAGRGVPVTVAGEALVELAAWVAHRTRRVQVRTATKNQLLGQLDRAFPGLTLAVSDVLGSKVGRLVAGHFSDPTRLARLGVERFRDFAARRDVQVNRSVAGRLVGAARAALPTAEAVVARQVLAADLALLDDLDAQIAQAQARIAALVPATEYAVLTSVPGWGSVRVGAYAAALGPISRWPAAAKIYRAAGLTPTQYESAGRRRDGGISREGSVPLRRALLDLGVGLWHQDCAARGYAGRLRERGKPGGVIACALAHRANKIAYAMIRDQKPYDPHRWA